MYVLYWTNISHKLAAGHISAEIIMSQRMKTSWTQVQELLIEADADPDAVREWILPEGADLPSPLVKLPGSASRCGFNPFSGACWF